MYVGREKMKLILRELGIQGDRNGLYKDSGDNIQACCPFHGETRPSCGINVYEGIGKCFACEETFNLPKLVAHCLDYTTRDGGYNYFKAEQWLEERFNIECKECDISHFGCLRIEDEEEANIRFELPKAYIAPFKSGKVTHNYFFARGFTKETAKKFMIGWDKKKNRVTIPVFWGDGALAGVIGRAVLEMKDSQGRRNPSFNKVYQMGNDTKYHIYENFPVGDVLFPLPHFKPREDGLAVLVEGQFDSMWLHQLGFSFVLSTLGSKMPYNKRANRCKQAELLSSLGVTKVLLLRDDDEAGQKGAEHDAQILKGDFRVFKSNFPEGKTDPQQLNAKEFENILKNMKPYYKLPKIPRLS